MTELFVLIDYDNVIRPERSLGSEHVIRKTLRLCETAFSSALTRVVVRLYGGWYENGAMTRNAQKLTQEISTCSPFTFALSSGATFQVKIELAKSILADPVTLIDNTFRRRSDIANISVKTFPWSGCVSQATCGLNLVHALFSSGCTISGCQLSVENIFEKNEQKVVDSMLVADMIELSLSGNSIVVVSRDDDMWPGLRMALARGVSLVHLLTQSSGGLPRYYSALRGSSYKRVVWS